LLATAGNDLRIEAGESTLNVAEQHKYTSKGFLSKKTTTTHDTLTDVTALASTFSGDSVTLGADRDIAIKGSNVVATRDTTALATRNLSIEAAAETHNETHFSKTKQSGVFSSGGAGFTIGSKQQSTDQKTDATTAAKSTVGSTDGNVTLLAGETYRQVGSDVVAPKGDIDIAAKTVDIVEARETSRTVTEQKFKQSGLTVSVSSPVITAVQTVQQMSEAAADTKDGRMKALAAANSGLAVKSAVGAVVAGQGTTIDGKEGQIATAFNDKGEAIGSRDANAADQMGGIGINVSIGGSKSSSKTTQTSSAAVASNLTAGQDITITASGAGKDSDITLQGAKAAAVKNLTLSAEDEIRLLAAANTTEQQSTNKSSSASVGVGFMVGGTQNGFTIQAGVSGGQGKTNGSDTTWTNTHVEAGQTLTLESGGNTTLKGATAKGEQVIASIGGNLAIESLQDTSTYNSRQKSLGGSISLCIPPFCYGAPSTGSVNASNSKITSDYASVTEQSGLKAGDGGFQVDVKGNTDLKGGAITSTQAAIDNTKNSFQTGGELTLSDIQNKADYKAKAASINLGTGFSPTGELVPQGTSVGFGKDSGSASSTTQAAISGIAGNQNARTGDAETGIGKIFDQQKVQKEIDAQVKITQMFGQQAPKAAADFAKAQATELRNQGNFEEAVKWDEGGAYRIALHTVIGGLAGDVQGALGAGAAAAAAPLLNELQRNIAQSLKDAGASDTLAKAAGQLISGVTATGIGAAVGGGTGAAMGLNVDANNRQLHPDERKLIRKLAEEKAQQGCKGDTQCYREALPYWTDALERVAESRIDDREFAKNGRYLSALERTVATAGAEGKLGAVDRYLADLKTAADMLQPYSGKPIGQTGQTYFLATPEQRADYTINYPLGLPPSDSIIPGMAERDQSRLERFAAANGSAQPVAPLEEAVLGGMVTNRIATALGRAWTSLDVYLAGRVGASAGGNISTQQITREGMAASLNAAERAQLSTLNSMPDGAAQGVLREKVTNDYFARNGFAQLESKCGSNNCFDGVFVKGDTVYVVETKPLQANGAIKLNGPEGDLPTQMTQGWIDYSVKRLLETGDPAKQQTAALIQKALDPQSNINLVKIVAGVNENGVTLVKLAK